MSKCYIHANLVKIHQLAHEILCCTRTFWLKFGSLSPAKTLKNRSRSPKPNLLFIMSQCYIHANLVEICQPVHEIWYTSIFWLKFGSLSPAVIQGHQNLINSSSCANVTSMQIPPPLRWGT